MGQFVTNYEVLFLCWWVLIFSFNLLFYDINNAFGSDVIVCFVQLNDLYQSLC